MAHQDYKLFNNLLNYFLAYQLQIIVIVLLQQLTELLSGILRLQTIYTALLQQLPELLSGILRLQTIVTALLQRLPELILSGILLL